MTTTTPASLGSRDTALLRRGRLLEAVTPGWNVAGIAVLTVAVASTRSVALAGFGLDSLIEKGVALIRCGDRPPVGWSGS